MSQDVFFWLITACTALCVCAILIEAGVGIALALAISPALKRYVSIRQDAQRVVQQAKDQVQKTKPGVLGNSARLVAIFKAETQRLSEDRAEITGIVSSARRMGCRVRNLSLSGRTQKDRHAADMTSGGHRIESKTSQ
jgi:hypothetical protein